MKAKRMVPTPLKHVGSHYSEFNYGECHYGECHYAECRGAVLIYVYALNLNFQYWWKLKLL